MLDENDKHGMACVIRGPGGPRIAHLYHVILNFKYCARNAGDVLEEIGQEILPQLATGHGDGA